MNKSKRIFDFLFAFAGLTIISPILLVFALLVFLQDFRSPLYLAPRVARGGGLFTMIKLRSMVINADKTGVDSTSSNDMRITRVGHLIRKFKLDELTQLWNVLIGDMSLVGPRPQVQRDVDLYTDDERGLLIARPGITDFSSIIFSDEGEILAAKEDPDIAYNQLIRPWKSRLGLLYIAHSSIQLDIKLICLTAVAIVSRSSALRGVTEELTRLEAPEELIKVSRRDRELIPAPPPGAEDILTSRD